ncbi:hypothetical protein SUGI_0553720 [Cryptomeria japonica]|nr:hypothetical protein SUGI_0553720 [Cryptomeria japonica]
MWCSYSCAQWFRALLHGLFLLPVWEAVVRMAVLVAQDPVFCKGCSEALPPLLIGCLGTTDLLIVFGRFVGVLWELALEACFVRGMTPFGEGLL